MKYNCPNLENYQLLTLSSKIRRKAHFVTMVANPDIQTQTAFNPPKFAAFMKNEMKCSNAAITGLKGHQVIDSINVFRDLQVSE